MPLAKLMNILTISVYEEHAFVIKDIVKLAKTYVCSHCLARLTQAGNFQRRAKGCAQGEALIDFPAKKVEALQTTFEKAFFPKHSAWSKSLFSDFNEKPLSRKSTFTT